jgi:type I restriction enzyme S subunit
MSRIDDLIRAHCPEGVANVELAEILHYEQPTRYLVATTDYDDSFDVPVLTAGQTFILGYTSEVNGVYPASSDSPVIIFDDFTTAFRWVDFPFKAKSSAMKMLTMRDGVEASFRFIWYAMQCIGFSPSEHARHWISQYSRFTIPLPPLEVQQEIVRVLDLFQSLEAELEAELEARRRQYTHYRDSLLDFSERGGVRWMTLGEICLSVSSGGTPSTSQSTYYGGSIPWVRTQEIDYALIESAEVMITDEGLRNSSAKWIPANCVIIAMYGATAAKAAINIVPVTTNQACCNLEVDDRIADFRYVYQWVCNKYVELRSLGEGSQANLNMQKIKNFAIPIPGLSDQRRIVESLDKFDTLLNDLSFGLPAELTARRSQYEHYRDRLLTFEEAA